MKICLGITGGIAAYKAPLLARELIRRGFCVVTVLSENATNFVTPLTLETLTGNPCFVQQFCPERAFEIEHVALSKQADAFLVAPATANLLGKVAGGIADDLLSTTIMAAGDKPVVFAPAMNTQMYQSPIVQENIDKLKGFGYQFVDPASGHLACGDTGVGRLAEIADLATCMEYATYPNKDYAGKHVLVTAGPTVEFLDPIRFVSNRSTGRMGFAIAKAARQRGAKVTLVAGPNDRGGLYGVDYVRVQTTEEMMDACDRVFDQVDLVVKAAAPVDFRPEQVLEHKIKKHESGMDIHLIKNIDVLRTLGGKKKHQKLVGFAAETTNVEAYAKKKLVEKNLDMIVANDISDGQNGFGGENNRVSMYTHSQQFDCSGSKLEVGHAILTRAKEL